MRATTRLWSISVSIDPDSRTLEISRGFDGEAPVLEILGPIPRHLDLEYVAEMTCKEYAERFRDVYDWELARLTPGEISR